MRRVFKFQDQLKLVINSTLIARKIWKDNWAKSHTLRTWSQMFMDIPLFLSLSGTSYVFKMFWFGANKNKKSNPKPYFLFCISHFKDHNGAQWIEFPVKLFRKSFCMVWKQLCNVFFFFFLNSFFSNLALKPFFLVSFTLSLILSQNSLPPGALSKDIYLGIELSNPQTHRGF